MYPLLTDGTRHFLAVDFAGTRQLKLSSYDRLFPNQDTMPKGGFGKRSCFRPMPRRHLETASLREINAQPNSRN